MSSAADATTNAAARAQDAGAEVDPGFLRDVMGRFATGITVVTTEDEGRPHGMTANSLTSVSLDPPLVLVCFVRDSRTALAVKECGAFVINLLDRGQQELSNRFARRGEDHFEGLDYRVGHLGLPVLHGGLGHLECEVHDIFDGGDHEIVVGRVVGGETGGVHPLVFFRGRYDALTGRGQEAEFLWYA